MVFEEEITLTATTTTTAIAVTTNNSMAPQSLSATKSSATISLHGKETQPS